MFISFGFIFVQDTFATTWTALCTKLFTREGVKGLQRMALTYGLFLDVHYQDMSSIYGSKF